MELNLLFPLHSESNILGTITDLIAVNMDNVLTLSYYRDSNRMKGYSTIFFHLTNKETHEWKLGKLNEFDAEFSRIKDRSLLSTSIMADEIHLS